MNAKMSKIVMFFLAGLMVIGTLGYAIKTNDKSLFVSFIIGADIFSAFMLLSLWVFKHVSSKYILFGTAALIAVSAVVMAIYEFVL